MTGYLADIQLQAVEPSLVGRGVGLALWGQVSVTNKGVAVLGTP